MARDFEDGPDPGADAVVFAVGDDADEGAVADAELVGQRGVEAGLGNGFGDGLEAVVFGVGGFVVAEAVFDEVVDDPVVDELAVFGGEREEDFAGGGVDVRPLLFSRNKLRFRP